MCGIAGIVAPGRARQDREAQVAAMLGAQWHRGPDDQRLASSGPVTLGTARLAIVDPQHATQPVSSADGRWWLTYNGEVYNHLTLRADLERAGWVMQTRGDAEVVLAAHAVWGPEAFRRLDGMFAYALWDALCGELLLVRDRVGIKPLYWRCQAGTLEFSSEQKGLLATSGGRGSVDVAGLAEVFAVGAGFPSGCGLGERTCFAGISALPAATWLRFGPDGAVRTGRWWSAWDSLGEPFATPQDAGEALQGAFARAVRAVRMGDAQVGACLSGGLDSSLITAELLAQGGDALVAATITYKSDHSDPDAAAAGLVAEHLRARYPGRLDHRWTFLDEPTWLHGVDPLVRAFDEPCWEPRKLGMMANYRTLRAAGCKVALSGEGADELFFGYYPRFAGWRPGPDQPQTASEFAAQWRAKLGGVKALFAPALQSGALHWEAVDAAVDDAVARWIAPYWRDPADRVRAVQAWYLHTFLPWLLADNDRFGMAWSIEARFPFLVNEMLDVALRMRPEWNAPGVDGLPDKALLRGLGPGRLPEAIWKTRVKAPMPTPSSLRYPLGLARRLEQELALAPSPALQVLSKDEISRMAQRFAQDVKPMLATQPEAGEAVSKYDPRLPVRTVHLFGALSTLRWWSLYL